MGELTVFINVNMDNLNDSSKLVSKIESNDVTIINESINIIRFEKDVSQYIVTTKSEPSEQTVVLFFDDQSFNLKKWEILDEFNQKTSLEFTNIVKNISIDLNKFLTSVLPINAATSLPPINSL